MHNVSPKCNVLIPAQKCTATSQKKNGKKQVYMNNAHQDPNIAASIINHWMY